MKKKIKRFWYNLLQRMGNRINQLLNRSSEHTKELSADDSTVINFLVMILKKILNHVFMQCDFEVVSDSKLADPLKDLCDDLHDNCYKIGAYMLGGSDSPQNRSECWVVPYFETVGGERKLLHSYLNGDRICITEITGEKITDCYMILDLIKKAESLYLFCRRHTLDDDGNLTISYFIGDEEANPVTVDIPEWDDLVQFETTYRHANHIGIGRYKSPVISFDGNDIYGKPINYGCGVIEEQIQTVISQIQDEFRSKRTMLFPDWSIVKDTDNNGNPLNMHCIDGYIYPIQKRQGLDGSLIDMFSPAIRESSYYTHLKELIKQYEALCGLSEIISSEQTGNNATATEVKALKIDNVSFEDNVRKAVRKGNIMTLEADSIYLNIRRDLWQYDETWTDIYDDEQQRLNNMLVLFENGAVEQIDLIKYWYPALTEDEAQEKLERINADRENNNQASLENMLNV